MKDAGSDAQENSLRHHQVGSLKIFKWHFAVKLKKVIFRCFKQHNQILLTCIVCVEAGIFADKAKIICMDAYAV